MTIALAIDVETSGLPRKGMALTDPAYPWPVQVGAVLFDFDGRDLAVLSTRIRSDGRSISEGAAGVHGVSNRDAGRTGIPEKLMAATICHMAGQAQYIVAFSAPFNRDILHASILRVGGDPRRFIRPGLQIVDLLQPSCAYTKLPSEHDSGSYRWPSLDSALGAIRNERPRQGHHDALQDAKAAKRLFLSLHHRGALDIGDAA